MPSSASRVLVWAAGLRSGVPFGAPLRVKGHLIYYTGLRVLVCIPKTGVISSYAAVFWWSYISSVPSWIFESDFEPDRNIDELVVNSRRIRSRRDSEFWIAIVVRWENPPPTLSAAAQDESSAMLGSGNTLERARAHILPRNGGRLKKNRLAKCQA